VKTGKRIGIGFSAKEGNGRSGFSSNAFVGLLVAGGALAVLAGCGGSHSPSKKSASLPPAVSAATAVAEAVDVPDRAELYGTVAADRTAAVSSRVMANVVAVRARVGDSVRPGDVLVEIDPQTARGQEAQARGALAQAQAAFVLAERNFRRFEALAKTGSASELELDMARMQYEQARGAVQQGEGAASAASSVAGESKVTAPFAGRVSARLVEPGDLAAPGRPLVMVESATGRRLVASVPASTATASGLAIGRTLNVRVDGVAAELKGTVVEMSPGADPSSHTFTATIELAGSSAPAGLTGRAFLDLNRRRAVLVPANAIVPAGGVSMVAVRDSDGKARSVAVTTGAAAAGKVEILSGLSGGETVLTGLLALPLDGAPVHPVAGTTP
jgi:RND family efflux transporter MFP subunit